VKACQGVGGRTRTQVVEQKRTAGTGMSNGKVMRKNPKFTATLVGCGSGECLRM